MRVTVEVGVAIGVLLGVVVLLKIWLSWAQPSDVVICNIERHFEHVGSAMNISRPPLMAASPGYRAYRVQLAPPRAQHCARN